MIPVLHTRRNQRADLCQEGLYKAELDLGFLGSSLGASNYKYPKLCYPSPSSHLSNRLPSLPFQFFTPLDLLVCFFINFPAAPGTEHKPVSPRATFFFLWFVLAPMGALAYPYQPCFDNFLPAASGLAWEGLELTGLVKFHTSSTVAASCCWR